MTSPEDRPRAPWAWVLLALLLGFMVWAQVGSSKKKVDTSPINVSEATINLKQALISRDVSKIAGTPERASSRDQAKESLQKILDSVSRYKADDAMAAKFTLTVGRELGLKPDLAAIKTLQASEEMADRVFGEIYEGPPKGEEWLRAHRSQLPETFLGRLAAFHAVSHTNGSSPVTLWDAAGVGGLALAAFAVLLMGLAALTVFVVAVSQGSWKPVGHPYKGISKADGDRLVLRFCLFMLGFQLIVPTIQYAIRGRLVTGLATVIAELAFFVLFWWMNAVPLLGVSDPLKKVLGETKRPFRLAFIGLAGFSANMPVLLVVALVSRFLIPSAPDPRHPLSDQLGIGTSPLTFVLLVLVAAVMAPILEELSFRGLLFPSLTAYMKPAVAIVLSGFLFASIHPQGPALWAPLAALGATAACLTYYTGSLIPSMVMHAVHNFSIMMMSIVLLS